ncbi:hypothetical protein KQI41_13105 [Tissierella pigra]|uniref:Uncharacterized protein n=1 Tax=Tissierella pigra TaxID=2607614 RepID=A0A6N7XKW1_9FIRM|nr:hypothetical protein [Tissierella pigra]MBU5427326.1 hypothetical protein [Tissierella pigra]MSU01422.1 hypothetical protein [Tissierella pigra]
MGSKLKKMFLIFCLSCVALMQIAPMISYANPGPPAREEEGGGSKPKPPWQDPDKPHPIGP